MLNEIITPQDVFPVLDLSTLWTHHNLLCDFQDFLRFQPGSGSMMTERFFVGQRTPGIRWYLLGRLGQREARGMIFRLILFQPVDHWPDDVMPPAVFIRPIQFTADHPAHGNSF